jgi:hypothetical protein
VNFSFILCLFVLWRLEEPVAQDPGAKQIEVAERSSLKASCALDHFYYPIIFFNITYSCISLILMGPNRSP